MQIVQRCSLLAVMLVGFNVNWSHAQSYPTKSIRIHTAGAGAGADFVARLIAPEMSAALGQPIVIENRPTGFSLATGVSNAPPDGYTLLVTGGSLWTGPLFAEAPYDVNRDFATIATLTRAPNMLVVTSSLPVKTVGDLIQLAKARPGELNHTSGSTGSTTYIAWELMKSLGAVNIVAISYKDQTQETTDLVSGRVQMAVGSVTAYAPQVKAGKLRALAIGGTQRSALFPDLPTVAETVPGFTSEVVNGFWAPAKTPNAIVRRLNQEAVRALAKPESRERLLASGQEPVGGTPEQLTEYINSDIARVSRLVKDVGIKAGK